MTLQEFGASIKTKYPQYKDLTDEDVGTRMLTKYPQYQAQVSEQPRVQTAPAKSTRAFTIPANPTGNPAVEAAKTVANIPASAVGFAGNVIKASTFGPVQTANQLGTSIAGAQQEAAVDPRGRNAILKDTITGLPSAAYHTLVPSFIQHLIARNPEEAARTITEDPVGQIAPLVLLARGAAEKAGVGEQFDQAITKTGKTSTGPVRAVGRGVSNVAGKVSSEVLGVTTGAGGEAIRQAYKGGPEFTQAMRGNVLESDIVNKAQDMMSSIKDTQRATYRAKLENIKEAQTPVDFKPVQNAMHTQLKNFGVSIKDGTLDFSRSSIGNDPAATHVIESAYKDITDWGNQPGDTTGAGLDILKKRLDDLYAPTNQSRAFIQGVKSTVTDTLKQNVPGYEEMTKGYADTIKLTNDIKSATGVGGKAGADTVIKKLTSSLKQNQEFRLEMVKQLEQNSGEDILGQLAGSSLDSWIPRGRLGQAADFGAVLGVLTHFISPRLIPELLSTSPRLVGEFVRGLGLTAQKTTKVLNTLNNVKVPTAAAIPKNQK